MSSSVSLVTNSLEYYDKNLEKYNKFYSKFKYYKLKKADSDTEFSKVTFFNKDKKKIFTSKYEVLGLYINSSKTWVWGWSVPSYNKNEIQTSKKILNYALDIPSYDENNPSNRFLKTELITSRFRISDPTQLDIHSAIASYLSKIPTVFKLKYKPDSELEQDMYVLDPDDNRINSKEYNVAYFFLLDYEKLG